MAATSPIPILGLLCNYYHPELTTPEAAHAYLVANPHINAIVRPSSSPNLFTLTYRTATGISNSRLKIMESSTSFASDYGIAPELRSMLVMTGEEEDPAAVAATRRGRRTRRRTTRRRRTMH